MTYRNRKSMTVWLGLLAMWLIVCAPVVSQMVLAARLAAPVMPQCSSTSASSLALSASMQASNSMALSMTMPMPMPMPAGMHHDPAKMLVACGYCDLLADHMVLPSIPPALPTVTVFVMIATVAMLSTRFTPLGAFPSGRPRGPPASARISL
jgi:hypothetical protein